MPNRKKPNEATVSDRPTYPEILKFFYKHSFPDQLGAPGSAVAQAIIYKSNELWFPAEFAMSNKELSQLSGEKLSNIGRTRQKVLDTCIVDAQPLFIYVSGKERRAGKYMINFNLTSTQLQDNFNSTSNSRQKQGKIDKDPNSTLPNETKPPPHSTSNIVTTGEEPEKPQPKDDDKDRFKWLLGEFQKADMHFTIVNDIRRQKVVDLLEYPDGEIEAVLYRAAEKGVQGANLISWAEKGLAEYDRLYNGGVDGLSYEKRDQVEKEIKELSRELENTIQQGDPKNDPWIEQTRQQIQNRREFLGRLE